MKKKSTQSKIQNAELNFIRAFLSMVYLIFTVCIGVLIYAAFGDHIVKWFAPIPEPIEERSRNIATEDDDWDRVENGIHVQTGLVYDEGFDVVRGTCTACHSAKLVTQNRATREGWKDMIVWMQETQGLWDLGSNEPIILDYLTKHYAPEEIERRPGLNMAEIEWYILEIDQEL